jgi:hypothetical protein
MLQSVVTLIQTKLQVNAAKSGLELCRRAHRDVERNNSRNNA